VQTYAPCCGQPLLVRYQNTSDFSREDLAGREISLWRYFEMLPIQDRNNIVSLGEGMTPVLALENAGKESGFEALQLKDESYNPTGSFKARGLSLAVSKAKELGIRRCIIPTAGNAGGALAAYCAKAEMECVVVMPAKAPAIFKNECRLFGATLILVDGLINDCAQKVNEIIAHEDFFDVSTLKEPYRLEGKKTMGYEIAEQMGWQLPDVVIYPAGGGTGLIGIWKAFQEMLQLGWIKGPLPKMIAVQTENCSPLMAAAKDPLNWKANFHAQASIAGGLVVPFPFGLRLMQQVLFESGGVVQTVTEDEIREGISEVAHAEGILLSPEGSATFKSLTHLRQKGVIYNEDKILLINTASGYKNPELIN
jgi:threonine synthase